MANQPMHPDTALAFGCFGFLSIAAICWALVMIFAHH